MADLVYATIASLDGYIADENGSFDWARPSDEMHACFNELWRETDKVVYSSTLDGVPEPRTRLERTFDLDVVRAMKATARRDLSIGGASLAAEAIRAGLVDRYLMVVVPTIVGGGTRALPAAATVALALEDERRFASGAVLLDYRAR